MGCRAPREGRVAWLHREECRDWTEEAMFFEESEPMRRCVEKQCVAEGCGCTARSETGRKPRTPAEVTVCPRFGRVRQTNKERDIRRCWVVNEMMHLGIAVGPTVMSACTQVGCCNDTGIPLRYEDPLVFAFRVLDVTCGWDMRDRNQVVVLKELKDTKPIQLMEAPTCEYGKECNQPLKVRFEIQVCRGHFFRVHICNGFCMTMCFQGYCRGHALCPNHYIGTVFTLDMRHPSLL